MRIPYDRLDWYVGRPHPNRTKKSFGGPLGKLDADNPRHDIRRRTAIRILPASERNEGD